LRGSADIVTLAGREMVKLLDLGVFTFLEERIFSLFVVPVTMMAVTGMPREG